MRGILLALALVATPLAPAHAATLRVAAQTMPLTQGNPYAPIAMPQAIIAQMVFDPLVHVAEGGIVEPALASAWVQENPTTWVFTLREGVTFSNGEPLTAEAVTEALTYLATPEGQRDSIASQDIGKTIASHRARDLRTVEIVTRTPDPILPLHLSFVRLPAPGAWRTSGRAGALTQPVGTGPFAVKSWTENRVVLTANKTSWRAPKVEELELQVVSDPVARVQALASRAVDIALGVGLEDRRAIERAGGTVQPRLAPNLHFIAFVTTAPSPLQDLRVRRALNHAINKETLIASFLDGATTPAGQFSHAGAFGFDPALKPYPYDPARAKALLAEAGHKDGFAFTMVLDPSSGSSYVDWFHQIAQDLGAVGVKMTVRSTTTARLVESVMTGKNWPGDAFAWTFAGFDSLRGYRFRSCIQGTYHCDQELMPLIAAAEAAPTEQARREATQALMRAERERPPGIMLWRAAWFDAIGRGVDGFSVENDRIRWDQVTKSP